MASCKYVPVVQIEIVYVPFSRPLSNFDQVSCLRIDIANIPIGIEISQSILIPKFYGTIRW